MNASALPKVGCVADLSALRARLRAEQPDAKGGGARQILVCFGGSCLASGAKEVRDALRTAVEQAGLGGQVSLVETGCMGPCVMGPVVLVGDDQTFYQGVKPEDAAEIVSSHICGGKRVERLLVTDPAGKTPAPCRQDIDFFKRQTQVVLRNCGWIDPERIGDAIARDGYEALAKVLAEMTSAAVIQEMKTSGLRGRGGAGFPTWLKWHLTRESADTVRYVLCNADEGDPGHTWTAACWRATRTVSSKAWPSPRSP
jgi:(2Fe-2S) ferredoxin